MKGVVPPATLQWVEVVDSGARIPFLRRLSVQAFLKDPTYFDPGKRWLMIWLP